MSEAPERLWIDPDILPSEWDKRYHCDVEYVRADRIEELEAKLAKAVEALEMADQAIMENTTDQDLLMWGEPTVSYIRTTLAELKGQGDDL